MKKNRFNLQDNEFEDEFDDDLEDFEDKDC